MPANEIIVNYTIDPNRLRELREWFERYRRENAIPWPGDDLRGQMKPEHMNPERKKLMIVFPENKSCA